MALKLAGDGACLVIKDLVAHPAHGTVDIIKAMGGAAVACVGNVTAPEFGKRFVKTALNTYGSLDIIINNAGYTWDNVIQKMADEQWYAIIEVFKPAMT